MPMGTAHRAGRVLIAASGGGMQACTAALRAAGYDTEEVGSGAVALLKLKHEKIDVGVIEDELADKGGLDIIAAVGRQPPIIVCSGSWNVQRAVEAMKSGAWDYLPRPLHPEEVVRAVTA